MRQYSPIWYLLRQEGTVSLRAHPAHHALIIRMVSKEKYEDCFYKRGLKKANKRAWIKLHVVGDVITFQLCTSFSLADLGLVPYLDHSSGELKLAIGAIPGIQIVATQAIPKPPTLDLISEDES